MRYGDLIGQVKAAEFFLSLLPVVQYDMCLLLISYKVHPHYHMIIAANRDEFHARPASAAGFWKNEPSVLAGRDLQAGGTWLGITKKGRVAAVTNYHEAALVDTSLLSRGVLVSDFLRRDIEPGSYADILIESGKSYGGFNIVFGTVDNLYYCSNRHTGYDLLEPGIHGLSNDVLNDNTYKIRKGKKAMKKALAKGIVYADDLFSLLYDREQPPGPASSSWTGMKDERFFSPIFITGEEYGTRCSTVIMIDREGHVFFSERSFTNEGEQTEKVTYEFDTAD